jgi:mono/diheme cytochrome c family protein
VNDSTGLASGRCEWHIRSVRVGLGLGLGLVLVLVLVLAACHGDVAGGATDGAQIFQSVCAGCHGPRGKPEAAMVARLGVRDLTAPELRAKITPELVRTQVMQGSQNKLMPAFSRALSDAQIDAVARYVASPQFVAPR